MKFRGKKIAEDIEKQTVRRSCREVRSLGSAWGPRLLHPSLATPTGYGEESISSLPYQNREGHPAPGGTWVLEVAGGNRDKVGDTQRRYTSTGTVDTGTREIEVAGYTWRREELGYVRP